MAPFKWETRNPENALYTEIAALFEGKLVGKVRYNPGSHVTAEVYPSGSTYILYRGPSINEAKRRLTQYIGATECTGT